ncbi:MAG: hypothetical protein F6K36_16230 [Symploca sp. SIO3C6]|nr:hypothetical protein [Symploca sp. SIO3C6]NET05816.1 hypothetical protein [Symploca sp. SIO2B6]
MVGEPQLLEAHLLDLEAADDAPAFGWAIAFEVGVTALCSDIKFPGVGGVR